MLLLFSLTNAWGGETTSFLVALEIPSISSGQFLSAREGESFFKARIGEMLSQGDFQVSQVISFPYIGLAMVSTAEPAREAESKLRQTPGVAGVASPQLYVRCGTGELQYIPEEPLYRNQWYLRGIDAPAAWDATRGDPSMVVAVVDTGVAYHHEDLRENMWINPEEIPRNGKDDDGNDIVDDYHGAAFYNQGAVSTGNPGDVLEDGGHGTHVAGTIAASENGVGILGVAPKVKIMGLRCFSPFPDGESMAWSVDVARCIDYILAMKARGVNVKAANFSLSTRPGDPRDPVMEKAYKALSHAGILTFIAAGNDYNDNHVLPVYPANYDLPLGVVVGAVDSRNFKAPFSNYGFQEVDIFAPGTRIFSTVPKSIRNPSGYGYLNGTSMACPVALGTAMLIWGANPALNPSQVRDMLLQKGTSVPELKNLCTSGMVVDAAKAVAFAKDSPGPSPDPVVSPTQTPTVSPTKPPKPSAKGGGGGCALGFAPAMVLILGVPLILWWKKEI